MATNIRTTMKTHNVTEMNRAFGRANCETFSCPPIGEWVKQFIEQSQISVDPFARNKTWYTWTNDLNPETEAQFHMDAEEFLIMLKTKEVVADLGIFDPPYSPRQISECYKNLGKKATQSDTQNAHFCRRIRDAMDELIPVGGIVLSFGWNSTGMGKARNYEKLDILLVNHGSTHNDTLCLAERKAA